MAKNGSKLSTMVGEDFEIYLYEMAKNSIKLSTMVGENFEKSQYISSTSHEKYVFSSTFPSTSFFPVHPVHSSTFQYMWPPCLLSYYNLN